MIQKIGRLRLRKESEHWQRRCVKPLQMLRMEGERRDLEQEATELMNIFGSILRKSECRFEHSIFEFVSPACRRQGFRY